MNTLLEQLNYHKSMLRVITNNEDALDGKTDLIAARLAYAANTDRLTEIFSGLVYPFTFVCRERITLRLNLRAEVRRMSDLGCMIATKHNDEVLLSKMKEYRTMAYKLSSFKLYVSALNIAEVLETYSADALNVGFTSEEVAAFSNLATQLSESMFGTRGQLDDRRNNRLEIRTLFRGCTALLRDHFDPFIRFSSAIFPEFATAYDMQRKNVPGSKKRAISVAESGEISGNVFNSATNEPVVNATVSIADFNLVVLTDEDGYFSFEGLPLTGYNIGCSAPGFDVPAVQSVTLVSGQSLEVDFMLVPAQPPVESATT